MKKTYNIPTLAVVTIETTGMLAESAGGLTTGSTLGNEVVVGTDYGRGNELDFDDEEEY